MNAPLSRTTTFEIGGRTSSVRSPSPLQIAESALRRAMEIFPAPGAMTWAHYDKLTEVVERALAPLPAVEHFDYVHAAPLQTPTDGSEPFAYRTRIAYTDFGGLDAPLICIGGLTSTLRRFDFLALSLAPKLRVIGFDLAGRGHSGWLREQSDYNLESYVAQLEQLVQHLKVPSVSILGSSLGGCIGLKYAARFPEKVRSLILNDIGPFIPAARRLRRAHSVARHYVFRRPTDLFRRGTAINQYCGPVPDAVLLHDMHFKTKWSAEEDGRVYTHDLRALLAYRAEARHNLDLWEDWHQTKAPVLLIHGEESDALMNDTMMSMRGKERLSIVHVPESGHTPFLCDENIVSLIGNWIIGRQPVWPEQACPNAHRWLRRLFAHAR